jgi:hypothetical protein
MSFRFLISEREAGRVKAETTTAGHIGKGDKGERRKERRTEKNNERKKLFGFVGVKSGQNMMKSRLYAGTNCKDRHCFTQAPHLLHT